MSEENFEMILPNGVSEAMLTDVLKKFQVNYEQSEQGPALTGHPDELENVKLYISQAIHDEMNKINDDTHVAEGEYQMGLPNGVGEAMLAHAIDKFDVKLEHSEYGPKLIGQYSELMKAKEYITQAIEKRLKELGGK